MSGGGLGVNEPRFVSESYFMDFKFEPGNYYLAGREKLEGTTSCASSTTRRNLFNDDGRREDAARGSKKKDSKDDKEGDKATDRTRSSSSRTSTAR